ncbi:hypothetical protein CC80DRAFT_545876 [Byssothecium circinans]|uniref:Uncharacterized protein n=1 Tax=Byssothecium circinans TaxID=147558 RepID=A0A6A5U6D6_9PLEO|nr:hypothetical protein CC80DRAFT_545876 [Byssothecium circinans]
MGQFQDRALDVTGALEDLKNNTRKVKEIFLTYQPARARIEETRAAQKLYAQNVAHLAVEVSKESRNAANAVSRVNKFAQDVEAHVAAARKTAIEGDVTKAIDEARKAETGSAGVVGAADEARKAKENAEDQIQRIVMLESAN